MKTWILFGLIGSVGAGAYLLTRSPQPSPPAPPRTAPATSPATSPPETIGPPVVDVTGIDHLLDPPSIPVAESESPAPVVLSVPPEHAAISRRPAPAELPRAAD